MPLRTALLLGAGAAVITWFVLLPRTRGAGWRVDEAHKVSETYALRLLLEGRWSDPAWSANIIDRTNPPVGKYLFGLAALASGEALPRVPSLSRLAGPDGVMAPYVADEYARPYLPLLAPARRGSALAIALTVGLLAFVAARVHSAAAAIIALAWGAGHWLTSQFGGDAIFDPLLAFFVFATVPLACMECGDGESPLFLWQHARRRMESGNSPLPHSIWVLLGVVCAMAFQTRLNGGIALAASLAVLLFRKRWKTGLIVGLTFAIAAIAINPYYWPNPVQRFAQQVSDLRTILGGLTSGGVRLPLWAADSPARAPIEWTALAKLHFTWITFGTALVTGAVAGCFIARRQRKLLVWSAVVIVGTLVWLPLPWARYLVVVFPPLALLASIGYAGVLRGVFEAWR